MKGILRRSETIMANKIFVITDTTSEIGKAPAMDLAKTGKALVMVAPDADQGNVVMQEIRLATQNCICL
jgi:short-subunit dehydrogenase